jgi:hypothetical protein
MYYLIAKFVYNVQYIVHTSLFLFQYICYSEYKAIIN